MRSRLLLLSLSVLAVLGAGLFEVGARGPVDPAAGDTLTASPFPTTPAPAALPTRAPDPEPSATASEPSPAPPSPPALAARVDTLLADPELAGLPLALSVRDASGAVVLSRGPAGTLLPASTQKLPVAAAALGRLGPDFRYTTRVLAPLPPRADGVVEGDLVLVGSGDPALATPTFAEQVAPQRPHTSLAALADRVAAAGVRRVTGGVLADPWVFADEPVAAGWKSGYVEDLDATLVSGLTVDAGRKLFVRDGRLDAKASPDPASEAAAALYVLLGQRGVQVDGGVGRTPGPATGAVLAEVTSPPLDELLRWMLQRSDNHVAEAVFRTLGAIAGDPTWAGADRAVREALAPVGLDWAGVRLADGSGLSREDRLSAAFLTQLDAALWRTAEADRWRSWQAVAGEHGTLRKRLRGTIGEGRLYGKTGSLEDVRTLSGTVTGPAGDRYHFALLVNAVPRTAREAVRRLQDELVLALAEDLHGCVRMPRATPGQTGSTTAYELHCAAA